MLCGKKVGAVCDEKSAEIVDEDNIISIFSVHITSIDVENCIIYTAVV